MFEKRRKNEEIKFLILDTPMKMPVGEDSPKDGDSVLLKFGSYRIRIIRIERLTNTSFSGIVDQIVNEDDVEVFEIGWPPNILVGDEVDFSVENIFECSR